MHRKLLLILITSLLGLFVLTSCNNEKLFNDLERKTYCVPKEEGKELPSNIELFFKNENLVLAKIKDFRLPKEVFQLSDETLKLIKETKILDIDLELNYTYDRVSKHITIEQNPKTIQQAGSKIKAFLPLVLDKELIGKSKEEKLQAKTLAEKLVDKEISDKLKKLLSAIKSITYNESTDEIIVQTKNNKNIIFRKKISS